MGLGVVVICVGLPTVRGLDAAKLLLSAEGSRTHDVAGYRWVRLDVDYFTNPKISRLSLGAKMLPPRLDHLCRQAHDRRSYPSERAQRTLRERSDRCQMACSTGA